MEKVSNKYAIIVAGGSGTRMGTKIAKQYLAIGGKPVLMHTLNQFFVLDPAIRLLLVLPEADFSYWDDLCQKHDFSIPHQLVKGGKSRFASVRNGLDSISDNTGLVAIHDGVRPFVGGQVIRHSYETAAVKGSAIAVIPLKDSIREIEGPDKSVFRDRGQFRLVQTPQTFQLAKIKEAFSGGEKEIFTDDATVFEYMGWEVCLIPGNPENIKLTSPEDLDFANYLLNKREGSI
ncbi:2-C-methyl-D-erythritol 4-phosphate cytidylyltransferase [Cyclobacterium jeungdonense]|uniref:2-C-methyl-D-erythritol 4-phosphate cytidylyltransferase n=1 Tax=Cyclobacterium jeungdonense TaxID=708087 RepID=A0ABT8C2Z5_9BACT|nr:2-C-methyl-D-erythritol 4-phosphate cytidylyltransferase [Cyclobacterium jeungdonense]MDN3686676.1 2-C-methyl-D-erythritol 4-phosphate cytidylyltransferase [Cyclobacterium jeungdonense]